MATLKINADIDSVRKGLLKISQEIDQKLSKKKISLFDSTTQQVLSGELERQLAKTNRNMSRLKDLASEYAKQISDSSRSIREVVNAKQNLLRTQKLINQEAQKFSDLEKAQGVIGSSGGGGGAAGLGLLSKFKGMMGPLGALLTVAGVGRAAWRHGSAAYGAFASSADSRVGLRGRGFDDVSGTNSAIQGLGFSPETVRNLQMQGSDMFGRRNAGLGQMQNTLGFSRAFGLNPSDVQGSASGLVGTLGRQGGAETFELLKKHATLIGESVDDMVGPYLKTAADMLTEMQQNGIPASDEILSAFSALTSKDPETFQRAAAQLIGMQRGVTGASGESSAFFQRAFAAGGIGGGRVGTARMSMEAGGMFGMGAEGMRAAGMSEADQQLLAQFGIAGGPGHFQKFARGVVGTLDSEGFGKTGMGRIGRGQRIQRMFGLQNIGEGMGALDKLERAGRSGDANEIARIQKELKTMGEGPETQMERHLRKIADSTEGKLLTINAFQDALQENLGEKIAKPVVEMKDALLSIESAILDWNKFAPSANMSDSDIAGMSRRDPEGFRDQVIPKMRAKAEALRAQSNRYGAPGRGEVGGVVKDAYDAAIRQEKLLERMLKQLEVQNNKVKPMGGKGAQSGKTR